MTEPFEPWTAVVPLVDTLEALRVDYYVGGSLASSYNGVARAGQEAPCTFSQFVAPIAWPTILIRAQAANLLKQRGHDVSGIVSVM